MTLRAPFPYFGGKRRVAPMVWSRLGNVPNYVEPFLGSAAILLARPDEFPPRVETVNDVDSYLSNFWRALKADPDAVASYADYPVNEADLHARHLWLVTTARANVEKIKTDPDFFDAKVAGLWVWGQCLWIGSGWCAQRQPQLTNDQGVIVPQQMPRANGVGVHKVGLHRWQGGGQGGGSGVHAPTLTQQIPQLSGDGSGAALGLLSTADASIRSEGLYAYLNALSSRLRRVRVCCGDWSRVLTPSITTYIGLTGVFLDPPYQHSERTICYSEDHDISADVRTWALEHGDDPKFWIALCGYEGEHEMPATWECKAWKAHGGYSRSVRGRANRERERVWFSPHCLKAEPPLFAEPAVSGVA